MAPRDSLRRFWRLAIRAIRDSDNPDDGGDDGFDPEEYAYFDSPLNADLHEVIPGSLLVSSCPRALPGGGAGWADRYDAAGRFVARDFSPAHAADHLSQFDAALCIRVGVPRYARDALDGTGLGLLDLYCKYTPAGPPAEAVARFLGEVDAGGAARGRVVRVGLRPGRGVPSAAARLRGAGGGGVAAKNAAGLRVGRVPAIPPRTGGRAGAGQRRLAGFGEANRLRRGVR